MKVLLAISLILFTTVCFSYEMKLASLDIKTIIYMQMENQQQYNFVHNMNTEMLANSTSDTPVHPWYSECAGKMKNSQLVTIFNNWLESTTASTELPAQKLYTLAMQEECRSIFNHRVLF